MEIKLTIPSAIIANMMISAIESGDPVTRGWCNGIYLRGLWEKRIDELEQAWYSVEKIYEGEFTIEIAEILDEGEPLSDQNLKKHLINREDFIKGLGVMAKEFPNQFVQVMEDNTDAPCADIFLQCVLFGEEKYA
jgi:hypothetical protein